MTELPTPERDYYLNDARILDILRDRVETRRVVGVVAGYLDEAREPHVVSYGGSPTDSSHTLDGDSVCELGCVTKVFTGLLTADLIARGELSFEAPIAEYLTEATALPSYGTQPITIRDLVLDTAGLPLVGPRLEGDDGDVQRMYAFLAEYQLPYPPGTCHSISHFGNAVLCHILTQCAGMSYDALFRERIAVPLGMHHTGICPTPEMYARLAQGHDLTARPTATEPVAGLIGCVSGLYSSVNDLLRFVERHVAVNLDGYDGPLADAVRIAQTAYQVQEVGSSLQLSMGLGWSIARPLDFDFFEAYGRVDGYNGMMAVDQKTGASAVVLANSCHYILDVGRHILDPRYQLAGALLPAMPMEVELDPLDIAPYIGSYRLPSQLLLTISLEEGTLFIEAVGTEKKYPLITESVGRFFVTGIGAQVTFRQNEDGSIQALVLQTAQMHLAHLGLPLQEVAVRC